MIKLTKDDFKRIDNDTNGNPRYVCHFLSFITEKDEENTPEYFKGLNHISYLYDLAARKAKQFGGKRFNNKQFGGGIVFQSYNIDSDCKEINQILNK